MCPQGPGNAVMGGHHDLEFDVEGEQYAPILDGENHWVFVGHIVDGDFDADAKCMTHEQLEGGAPEWGWNRDRAEVKQFIMCCVIN
mmetsp:Transcript_46671/g.98072  ORF Transcript_46671/g.98072 Transcript_46671/m.98072 type:complete len:86 (-) Transcript_46671:27-284(-)